MGRGFLYTTGRWRGGKDSIDIEKRDEREEEEEKEEEEEEEEEEGMSKLLPFVFCAANEKQSWSE